MARPPCPAPRPSVAPVGGIDDSAPPGEASIPAGGNGPVAALGGPGVGGTSGWDARVAARAFIAPAGFLETFTTITGFFMPRIGQLPLR
jgi:hypothetical protein